MWRKVNHKLTGIGQLFCVQISQIPEPDQSFCGFSYNNTFAFLSPRIHYVWIILDCNVRSVNNQQVIHGSTQCFIDGQKNNDDNLALEFEQWVELVYLKKL